MSHPDSLYDNDDENMVEDDIVRDSFDQYDDSMDGDHESGFASAGWGTDEDYGLYDGDGGD